MNWMARIFMGLLGLAFFAGLLAALCLYLVWATIRWLLTGQKPQMVLVWQQLRKMRQGADWGTRARAGHAGPATHSGDVVDVEVREVRPEASDSKLLK